MPEADILELYINKETGNMYLHLSVIGEVQEIELSDFVNVDIYSDEFVKMGEWNLKEVLGEKKYRTITIPDIDEIPDLDALLDFLSISRIMYEVNE